LRINIDPIIIFFVVTTIYWTFLKIKSLFNKESNLKAIPKANVEEWGFVVLVPALNEELVIAETIINAQKLPHNTHVVIIDDGSTDNTYSIASKYENDRTHILKREYPNAKKGKGMALNHAYNWVLENRDIWFPNVDKDKLIITVVDADGHLDGNLLQDVVSMMEYDKRMQGVQVPVSILGAENSLRLLMQDIEFVGFSYFVQTARHRFSSVGLGGNGQFVKIAALETLGENPWTKALCEDLDLGLRLLMKGFRIGYCNTGYVHQQGLTNIRALMKQRTRWIQGHYQSWKYLPKLIMSKEIKRITKVDTSLYIILVATVWIVIINMLINTFAFFGYLEPRSYIIEVMLATSTILTKVINVLLSFGVTAIFLATYMKQRTQNIKGYQLPILILMFYFYSFIWIYATLATAVRTLLRKKEWVKTIREVLPTSLEL
jgi:1,2-diacylglycerol 3-beta-glucosyltransferase